MAKVRAGVMSPLSFAVALRMSSISCRRRSAKWSAESLSSIFVLHVSDRILLGSKCILERKRKGYCSF